MAIVCVNLKVPHLGFFIGLITESRLLPYGPGIARLSIIEWLRTGYLSVIKRADPPLLNRI